MNTVVWGRVGVQISGGIAPNCSHPTTLSTTSRPFAKTHVVEHKAAKTNRRAWLLTEGL